MSLSRKAKQKGEDVNKGGSNEVYKRMKPLNQHVRW